MKSSLFGIGGVIAALAVLGIAFVLVPERLVTPVPLIALTLLAAAVALSFLAPNLMAVMTGRHEGNDATVIASIGPSAVIGPLVVVGALGAFILALLGMDQLAMALDILTVAGGALGFLALKGASRIVEQAAVTASPPSAHMGWAQQAALLSGRAVDAAMRRRLERTAEKFRFAASDVSGFDYDRSDIDAALAHLEAAVVQQDAAAVESTCVAVEQALERREMQLRAARNRA